MSAERAFDKATEAALEEEAGRLPREEVPMDRLRGGEGEDGAVGVVKGGGGEKGKAQEQK